MAWRDYRGPRDRRRDLLTNLIWFRPWSLNLFYEKIFAEVLFDHPELLSALGLVEQFGITSHNGKLDDESPAQQQREFDRFKKDLTQLRQHPIDRQSQSQRLSTHVLEWFLERQVEGEKYQWHTYPVNQLFGVQNQFSSFMANTHRLLNRKDCEYYLARLDALPKKFEQLLRKSKSARGKANPAAALRGRRSAQGNDRFYRKARFRKYSRDVVQEPRGEDRQVDRATTGRFSSARGDGSRRKGLSGLSKLIDYFRELLPKTTTDDGVWKLPDGDNYYAYRLRENTTTKLKPDEVHELGLQEVARIEGEMRAILDANGFAGQPIGQTMDKLGKDPRFLFSNDDKGRADALAQHTTADRPGGGSLVERIIPDCSAREDRSATRSGIQRGDGPGRVL